MDNRYLNTLSEVYCEFKAELEEKYGIKFEDDEKIIFSAKPDTFGDERGQMLGLNDSKFVLTNKRMFAENGRGIWTIDIVQDIISCNKVESKFIIFKSVYVLVKLNKEIYYGEDGKQKLNGFQFYFNKIDMEKFDKILNYLGK